MFFDFFQEREIFQGLSQQALSACMISVETAAQLVPNPIKISLTQVMKSLHFWEGKVTENQTRQSDSFYGLSILADNIFSSF